MFNVFHDVETGKITKVDLVGDELAEFIAKEAAAKQAAEAAETAKAAEELTKSTAKAALLSKLGISEDEAKLLLS